MLNENTNHPPKGLSYSALLNSPETRPMAAVENLFYEGHRAIFAGPFGHGKTYFCLDLSLNLATGREFLGRKIPRPYRTVFLDTENGRGEVKDRVREFGEIASFTEADLKLLEENWTLEEFDSGALQYLDLATPKGFKQLDTYVTTHEPEVMIIDCFGKAFSGKETDEERIKFFCAELSRLVAKHACLKRGFILFPHHLTKYSPEGVDVNLLTNPWEYLSRTRGSGRLLDLIQDRLALQPMGSPETYYVVNGIVRSGKIAPLVLQRNKIGFFELHDDKRLVEQEAFRGAPRRRELFDRILGEFSRRVEFTFSEVTKLKNSEGKEFSSQTISDTLSVASANGLLTKNPNGSYSVPKVN